MDHLSQADATHAIEQTTKVPAEARLRAILDSALDAIITIDPNGRIVELNPAAEEMFGYTKPEMIGHRLGDLIVPPELRPDHEAGLARYRESGEAPIMGQRLRFPALRADGGRIPVELTITKAVAHDTTLFTGHIRDLTEQERAEALLEENETWSRLVAEAGEVLASNLDLPSTLEDLARVPLPTFADWCVVDLVGAGGSLSRVAVAHAEPEKDQLARHLRDHPPSPDDAAGPARVIREGQSALYPSVTDEQIVAGLPDPELLQLVRRLGVHSVLSAPLITRRKTLGAITLVSTTRTYTELDQQRVEDLARRAALHVDNARLYDDHRHVARVLQQSFLPPELPRIPGLELAARYHPAHEAVGLGGDFYDVIRTGQHTWGLVLGDVCGKGAEAATLTALTRYTLRTAALQHAKPSEILEVLNEAILRQSPGERFTSVVYARLDSIKGGYRMTVSSGGHPLPFLVRAGEAPERVGRTGTVLGVIDHPDLRDQTIDLHGDDRILYFTDGLPEARRPQGTEQLGEDCLSEILWRKRYDPLEDVLDHLVTEAVEFQNGDISDDIALLALQITPSRTKRSPPTRRP